MSLWGGTAAPGNGRFTRVANFPNKNKIQYLRLTINLHRPLSDNLPDTTQIGEKIMASPAQILANRENAQRSTGPATPEGKRAASRNAIRHGLTGTQIVMPGEDPAAYEDLRQGLHDSHQPANEAERILVDQIAANAWRLMRAQRVETAFLAKLTEGAKDPDAALAEAFLEKPKELARMHRYVAAAQNAYYKAITQLTKLQKERGTLEADEIGFVSYPALMEPSQPATTHTIPEPDRQNLPRYSDFDPTLGNYRS
jgi:hypothetical protein